MSVLVATLIGIAVLIWHITRSIIVMVAAAVSMWSHDERRRAAARHILHLFGASAEPPDGDSGKFLP